MPAADLGALGAATRPPVNDAARPPQFRTVYELLDFIRRSPGLYIGGTELCRIASFLDGFSFAGGFAADVRESPSFYRFRWWLEQRLQLQPSTAGWHFMLTREADGDERRATLLFFELLDEYRRVAVGNPLYEHDSSQRPGDA